MCSDIFMNLMVSLGNILNLEFIRKDSKCILSTNWTDSVQWQSEVNPLSGFLKRLTSVLWSENSEFCHFVRLFCFLLPLPCFNILNVVQHNSDTRLHRLGSLNIFTGLEREREISFAARKSHFRCQRRLEYDEECWNGKLI